MFGPTDGHGCVRAVLPLEATHELNVKSTASIALEQLLVIVTTNPQSHASPEAANEAQSRAGDVVTEGCAI
jgi:hypothetical protein